MSQLALSWQKSLNVIGSGSSVDNEVSGSRMARHRTRWCMKGKVEALIGPNLLAVLDVPIKRMSGCWMGYFYASTPVTTQAGNTFPVVCVSLSICELHLDFIQICLYVYVMLSVNRLVVYVLYVPTVSPALLSGLIGRSLGSLWILRSINLSVLWPRSLWSSYHISHRWILIGRFVQSSSQQFAETKKNRTLCSAVLVFFLFLTSSHASSTLLSVSPGQSQWKKASESHSEGLPTRDHPLRQCL